MRHSDFLDWLNQVLSSDATFGISDLVLSGFLRIVTHPRVFGDPTPLPFALQFAESLRHHPNAVTLAPGERHWDIFRRLCQEVNAKGNLIADAYLAALAIEADGLRPTGTMPVFLACVGSIPSHDPLSRYVIGAGSVVSFW